MLEADVIVIGGGVAGASAALAAAREGASVALLTKAEETNTGYAQGGVVYTGPDDRPNLLVRDILAAGDGDLAAARTLAAEGPRLVRELLIEGLGVPFDRDPEGFEGLHLTREAAHSVARIVHRADTTGLAVQTSLSRAIREDTRIETFRDAEVLKLQTFRGRCCGVYARLEGSVVAVRARRGVVLATGGLGALYEHTTNPPGASGDGYALALEAGAEVRDLHYVQFHPTALYSPGGERFLVSEAVRGEGGVLLDPDGEPFVEHPLGSLAPRDVVAREVWAMMKRTGSPCAYLNITHRSGEWLRGRFPEIHARLREAGVEMSEEPVPVVPAAHYSCGGVTTDLSGRSNLPGLWAAGEVASTGLHGGNRLASTSLLEGLVFGRRAGLSAARSQTFRGGFAGLPPERSAPERVPDGLKSLLWRRAGLARSAEGLRAGLNELRALEDECPEGSGGAFRVARKVLEGALAERRSRGCHFRADLVGREMRV